MYKTSSFVETISSVFAQSLSAFTQPEWQNITEDLHSFTHLVTSLEYTVENCLSSIPTHPYDRLKYQYFESGHKFKTLEDLEEPEKLPYEKCLEYVKQKNEEVLLTTFHNLTCCEEDQIHTAFTCCSGNKILPDFNRQGKYIEFLELTKNISLEDITNENCQSIAKKLIAEYMKIV